MILKAVLIDDEKNALVALRMMLEQFCPDVEISGESQSALDAVSLIRKLQPDVVFLDIEMPGGTGFDLLAAIDPRPFATVFTTAHEQYTIPAIRAGAVDYLLKPVNIDELRAAIERIRAVRRNDTRQEPIERITISNSEGTWFVNADEIICIEGSGRHSRFYLDDGIVRVISNHLGELEPQFEKLGFFRVHKSSLVNCRHVKHISTADGGFAVLSNGKEIEISRRKRGEFMRIMGK